MWLLRATVAAIVLALAAVGRWRWCSATTRPTSPRSPSSASYDPPQVTRVLARDGTVLGEVFVERRTLVPIDEIPSRMKLAALAAEDASFYEHAGLNYLGMLRALLKDVTGRSRQGGSTITQQVIKNVLLTPERTVGRKVREAILARRIEAELTKDEILGLYLNHIYFGHGRYGVEEAARYYFGKGIRDVSLGEAAMLAGIIKGPQVYSPRGDLGRARARQAFVLDQMVQKGFARADQAAAAKGEAITLAPEPESRGRARPRGRRRGAAHPAHPGGRRRRSRRLHRDHHHRPRAGGGRARRRAAQRRRLREAPQAPAPAAQEQARARPLRGRAARRTPRAPRRGHRRRRRRQHARGARRHA